MKTVIRALAALTMLLSAVGLLAALAAGVGLWVIKGPATDRATRLFGRIDGALDLADSGLVHARTSLGTARQNLELARDEQRKLAKDAQPGAVRRTLARTVQRQVAPQVDNAQGKLTTVAEAAVVVNSILEDLGNFPMLGAAGLDVSQLQEINTGLAKVGPAAWGLSRMLGQSEPEDGEELGKVEQALTRLATLLDEYKLRVGEARGRTDAVKEKVFTWLTPAVVIVSAVCFWIALSQLSLLCHARAWWKRAGAAGPS